jgi:hypothetical protein
MTEYLSVTGARENNLPPDRLVTAPGSVTGEHLARHIGAYAG